MTSTISDKLRIKKVLVCNLIKNGMMAKKNAFPG